MLKNNNKGMTLTEISIVLVIIGLITGAVTTGISLLEQAKLKSVKDDALKFIDAGYLFKVNYNAWPGDASNIDEVIPHSTACEKGTGGHIKGNGDGLIQYSVNIGSSNESYAFFCHLRLAGYGAKNLKYLENKATAPTLGKHMPASKVLGGFLPDSDGQTMNYMMLYVPSGASGPSSGNGALSGKQVAALKYKYDNKSDKANEGNIRALNVGTNTDCVTSTQTLNKLSTTPACKVQFLFPDEE